MKDEFHSEAHPRQTAQAKGHKRRMCY
ncbi:uncharacterized protein G2W53_037042 [Senna tora]|uniref:Uncharacterized protein n=1 Tax=Senna tora TaxID=362788 RepID=A0A834T5S5_9FABA|nr:uncharacterized protein G2W53_037042 [Senna tora]